MKINAQYSEHIEITMVLSREEAQSLRDLVQNPVSDDESPEQIELREQIFQALTKKLVR